MTVKEHAKQMLDSLPDDMTWNDLAYRCMMRESLDRAEADFAAGRVYTQEQIEAEVEEWLVSFGLVKPDAS
jgi:hypothetical protein